MNNLCPASVETQQTSLSDRETIRSQAIKTIKDGVISLAVLWNESKTSVHEITLITDTGKPSPFRHQNRFSEKQTQLKFIAPTALMKVNVLCSSLTSSFVHTMNKHCLIWFEKKIYIYHTLLWCEDLFYTFSLTWRMRLELDLIQINMCWSSNSLQLYYTVWNYPC